MTAPGSLRIGFIGFGEAASEVAGGLASEGLTSMVAYDLRWNEPPFGDLICQRAARTGVRLLQHPAMLAAECDVIFSLVVSSAAITAARSVAPALRTGQWYADLNSASPGAKQEAGGIITAAGGEFVDVAVMGPAPGNRHKAPMLCAGPRAGELAALLNAWNMKLEYVGAQVGQAAAIKMFRSVVVKGLEALLVEALVASYPYGAHETVVQSIQESFGEMNWSQIVAHLLPRHAIHAERRAHEMSEAVRCLEDAGITPLMAEAAHRRLQWAAEFNLKEHYGGELPSDWRDVIAELDIRGRAASSR